MHEIARLPPCSMPLSVQPAPENGLRKSSQVMIDKIIAVRRETLGPPFGRLDPDAMLSVTRSLAVFLGLA